MHNRNSNTRTSRSGRFAVAGLAGLLFALWTYGETFSAKAADEAMESCGNSLIVVAAEYSTKTAPFWDSIAQKAADQAGLDVNVQVVPWNDIHQRVTTLIQTGQRPDVLNYDTWANHASDGLLHSTQDVLSEETLADLIPSFAASGTLDGVGYGMPFVASDSLLYYNIDLFEQAGIAAPPATWAELKAAAEAITALEGRAAGYALALGPGDAQVDFAMWIFSNGGDYYADGAWVIDSDKNLETVTFLRELAEAGLTEINPGNTNRVDGTWALFTRGGAGMTIAHGGFGGRIRADNPDLNWGTTPMPVNGDLPPVSLGIADYAMALKQTDCDNTEALRSFLSILWDPDNLVPWVTEEGFLPTTSSGVEGMSSMPEVKPFLDLLEFAKFAPTTQPCYDPVIGAVKNNIGLAMSSESPAEVLARIQAASAC